MKKIKITHTVYICLALMLAVLLPGRAHAAAQAYEIAVEFSYETGAVPWESSVRLPVIQGGN